MILALFDFDGTITKKDSLLDFTQFAVGLPGYYFGLLRLSPVLIAYALNLVSNHFAKQSFIAHFFKGWDASRFKDTADRYSAFRVEDITRPKAVEKIKWHRDQGHHVVIVSASIDSWLREWCQRYKLDLIATTLEIKDGKLTGKFSSENCHGSEKVRRVRDAFDFDQLEYIYAYGDSRGDKELLSLADESFYRPFR